LDVGGFEFGVGAEVGDEAEEEGAEIAGLEVEILGTAAGELEDVADEVVDAFDLFVDAVAGLGAEFGADSGEVEGLGGEADDAEGVFEVMDDALGEAADDGEAFGLDEFLDVEVIEIAEAVADLLEEGEGEGGGMFDEGEHFAAGEEKDFGGDGGGGGGGAGTVFDDGHFAEDLAGAEAGKDAAAAGAGGDFHEAGFDEIDAIAGGGFAEDFLAGGELAFLGDEAESLELMRVQKAEQGDGFQRHHGVTLRQNGRG